MIQFHLYDKKNGLSKNPVVCFSKQKYTKDAVEIKWEDGLPLTWKEGYKWSDLNILTEAVFEFEYCGGMFPRKTDRIDYKGLHIFIRAFLSFEDRSPMYMHVWEEWLAEEMNCRKV